LQTSKAKQDFSPSYPSSPLVRITYLHYAVTRSLQATISQGLEVENCGHLLVFAENDILEYNRFLTLPTIVEEFQEKAVWGDHKVPGNHSSNLPQI
jgi:hypothetical protein